MKTETITILGLGRLGTSVGLAIKASSLEVTLVGYEENRTLGRQALEDVHAIDKVEWNLYKAVVKADIVVITIPSSDLEAVLSVIGDELQEHTLVIDLSGMNPMGLDLAKRYMTKGHYVGAVPVLPAASLADGRSDNMFASKDYFRNGSFCLMPSPKADPQAVETAVNFGLLIGSVPFFLDPDEYDSLVQGTATLPGLAAAAMFKAVQTAVGWRDMLRFAGTEFALATLPLESDVDVTLQALQNKDATLRWMDAFMNELQQVRRWIYDGDRELFAAYFSEINYEREQWLGVREKNDWDERTTPEVKHRGFSEQMFGGLAKSFKKDEDDR